MLCYGLSTTALVEINLLQVSLYSRVFKYTTNIVKGFQAATGNGDLIVGSTSKQYIGSK